MSKKRHEPTPIDEQLPPPPGEPVPAAHAACDVVVGEESTPQADVANEPQASAAEPPHEERADVRYVVLSLPLAEPARGYLNQHVDVQLTPPQARALKALLAGLDAKGFRLGTGRRPATGADAVRWLLDQMEGARG